MTNISRDVAYAVAFPLAFLSAFILLMSGVAGTLTSLVELPQNPVVGVKLLAVSGTFWILGSRMLVASWKIETVAASD